MVTDHLKKTTIASIRYFVNDMDAAIAFYAELLGFQVVLHPNSYFALLLQSPLRLVLSRPGGGPGGGQAMPDGTVPTPGGWNRISLEVDDIEATVNELKGKNAKFRNEIITGVGGKQILLEDPSGNL